MVNRDSQPDESSKDIDAVRRRCAASGQLSGGPRDVAGIATASDSPTISAAGLPRPGSATGLPWSSAAAGLCWSRIRRTNRRATAVAAGGGAAAARGRDGVDTGLLELGRRLGVGAGPLCRPTLCSCRLGSRSVAPTTRQLGLGPGTLAALGYELPAPGAGYTVTVRGLVLMCSIGIRRREREQRQRVRISVDLIATAAASFPGDDRRRVINYEKVVAAIREIARSGHIDLCEGFAERICAACFADTRVERVRVWVEKLDVFSDAEGVGAMLERTRPLSGASDRSP